ncbi:MAG: nucleotidyltransferase family protein [Desulfuromonadales bacterium]|nr:MAG: nucleotidyltransferase family protein [Desulfuromonadales bacterium]
MKNHAAAILLAAGRSRRMGCCKQLLPLGQTTVIGRCLDTLVSGGINEIVVVVSEEGNEVARAAGRYPVRVVVNPQADGDMASSIRAGRDALTVETGGVIVALCDYPLVVATTVARLIRTHIASPGSIIIPCHDGRRGHPLLLPRPVLDELEGWLTLRDLVRLDPGRTRSLEVDDPGVLIDMDTPEDYRRICNAVAGFDVRRGDGGQDTDLRQGG